MHATSDSSGLHPLTYVCMQPLTAQVCTLSLMLEAAVCNAWLPTGLGLELTQCVCCL